MKNIIEFVSVFISMGFGVLIGFHNGQRVGVSKGQLEMKTQAINTGNAYYNPTNAQFTWKTNR
jgi:hypothetical protein